MTTTPADWHIRAVQPDDAVGVIALISSAIAEPINNLLTESDEFTMTEAQERAFLAEQSLRPDWAGFVAVLRQSPDEIIGIITAEGKGRRAIAHRAALGVTVAQAWRGQGVGKALMRRAIAWGQEHPSVTRLELEVLARNLPAIALYESLGFQQEGVARRAIYRNGEYLDELLMALFV
jgi:RimJ/RimL family protein N-acetyltransferase